MVSAVGAVIDRRFLRVQREERAQKQNAVVKQHFSRLGAISLDMTPAELGLFLQRELEKWTKVIQAGGIQPD